MRVVGDLTLNHTGVGHDWFAPRRPTRRAERDFYYFDDSLPHGYAAWWASRSLPKLNWRSAELARAACEVVARRWLEPFGLDGWRIDVANMTGRYRGVDLNAEVRAARARRRARADALARRRARRTTSAPTSPAAAGTGR